MKLKSTPKKFNIKKLPKDSYVMVRSKNGYVKKTDKKTNYIIEVRNRKTKKVIGYINKSKAGKPVPQKFINRKTFQKVPISKKIIIQDHHTFSVHFKKPVLDQVRSKGCDLVYSIMYYLRKNKKVYFELVLNSSIMKKAKSSGITLEYPVSRDLVEKEIMNQILETITKSGLLLRTSPKKYASKETKNKYEPPTTDVDGYIY